MLDVVIALLPAAIAGIVLFGWYAAVVEVVSVLAAVATEFVYYFIANGGFAKKCKNAGAVCKKWWKQFDNTSIVTGLILALIVPVTVKWYEILLGAIFAIAIVKMLFGGTGKNLVNPAATGRVFMFISFGISTYVFANFGAILDVDGAVITSGATNILSGGLLQGNGSPLSVLDLFLGTGLPGCIGETCKLALIVGYIYLVIRKVIKWWQPLLYVVLSAFLSVCLAAIGGTFDISLFPAFAFSGGLMFGAIFMATDYVTSPKGVYGQLVYYICLAVLTSLLRYYIKVEVVSFVIMLMNLIVPLIDTYIVRKPFGYKKEKKQKEGK
jgi:electron transport complex protein RnfD